MNTNNNPAQFTTLDLVSLGYCAGQVAEAYSESLSVAGSVFMVQGETDITGTLSVRNAERIEVDNRVRKHWDRARVAGWVASAMAEIGVSL